MLSSWTGLAAEYYEGKERLFNDCMKARGWRLEEADGAKTPTPPREEPEPQRVY